MKIAPLGDSAVTISFSKPALGASRELLRTVWALREAIDKAAISGVTEVTASYSTVTVFYDPIVLLNIGVPAIQIFDWLTERINLAAADRRRKGLTIRGRKIEVPVCFEDEFGLDLPEAAATSRLTVEEVIKRFCAAHYEVVCIGFTPGFPYLNGLPQELALPRRATPRTAVPAGSVGIGGNQAGIYPSRCPGGWNVLGRTPLMLFDPTKSPPSLLNVGDRIRFKRIDPSEFGAQHDRLWQ
jgi:inhibitor of KinA